MIDPAAERGRCPRRHPPAAPTGDRRPAPRRHRPRAAARTGSPTTTSCSSPLGQRARGPRAAGRSPTSRPRSPAASLVLDPSEIIAAARTFG
ncbi:MAG: hypothetical protein U5R31_17740 [Acidimicrobiia bacterium]|nr:hypothetical protein [Acidimicrobiia bacterium]